MVVITDVVKYQHLQEAVDSDPELGLRISGDSVN